MTVVVKGQAMTEAHIANLPVKSRRVNYYLGRGLAVVVVPDGKRYFTVYATITNKEGWRKQVQRSLGYWPRLGLEEARRQAIHYRALAATGVDIRRSKKEIDDLHRGWRAERAAKVLEAKRLATEAAQAKALARLKREEERAIAREAREQARQLAAQKAAQKKAAQEARLHLRRTHKPPPAKVEGLTLQELLTVPWSA